MRAMRIMVLLAAITGSAVAAPAQPLKLSHAWIVVREGARETGYSPIGVVFDRTAATPDSLPFPTWKIRVDGEGTFIEMMTPRETPKALSLSIHPPSTDEKANQAKSRDPVEGAMFRHPNGARRLTGLRIVAPNDDGLPPSTSYIADHGVMTFAVGDQWLLEVTLDRGAQKVTKNLRPDLPMIVHF